VLVAREFELVVEVCALGLALVPVDPLAVPLCA